jgi:Zinc knuckle
MTEGPAKKWKNQFLDEWTAKPAPVNPNDKFGTFADFSKAIRVAFTMYDSEGDALEGLRTLRMKRDELIDAHVAKFKTLAALSKVNTNNALAIELFKDMLPEGLKFQLMRLENAPITIQDWYDKAVMVNHQNKKIKRSAERTRTPQKKEEKTQTFYFPRKEKDPNTMDVDRLSIEERNQLMKEGRCFKCKNTGHRANDCLNNKKKETAKKRINGKELHTHVRSLFKGMTEEEKEEFLKEAEDAGF